MLVISHSIVWYDQINFGLDWFNSKFTSHTNNMNFGLNCNSGLEKLNYKPNCYALIPDSLILTKVVTSYRDQNSEKII